MPEPLIVRLCGVRWRIDLSALYPENTALADRVRHLWARATVQPDGTEHTFVITRRGETVPLDESGQPGGVQLTDPARFPYVLSRAVTLACISARRGSALMLHAAGLAALPKTSDVADSQPVPTLVLVAGSGSGKSTAVRTLGPQYGYLTDESVVIEPDLTISPHPKPISLAAADRAGDKDEHSPDDLGLGVAAAHTSVGAVILLNREDDAIAPQLEPMGLADAILAALPQTSSIQVLDAPLQRLAQALTRGGGPYRLTFAQIGECADLLAALLINVAAARVTSEPQTYMTGNASIWAAHTPPPEARLVLEDATSSPTETPDQSEADDTGPDGAVSDPCDQSATAPPTAFRRAPWTDAIEIDGEVIVLRGTQPARLSGIGATIWLEASTPQTITELADHIVSEHGAHPDAQEKIAEAVDALLTGSVLQRK